jgi:hypothetical protein
MFAKMQSLKIKTFTGTDSAEVDKRVNDWLAKSKGRVWRTTTAFKGLRYRGKGVVAGLAQRGVGIAISVWYDEPRAPTSRKTRHE